MTKVYEARKAIVQAKLDALTDKAKVVAPWLEQDYQREINFLNQQIAAKTEVKPNEGESNSKNEGNTAKQD